MIRDVQEAARAKGCNLLILKAGTESEIDATFASFDRLQAGGLVVSSDPFFDSQREQLVTLAARYAIPAIYEWREFAKTAKTRGLTVPLSVLGGADEVIE